MRTINNRRNQKQELENHGSNPSSFFNGLLWGAAIGSVIGVLFAPDKGEETRKKVKKVAREYEDKGKETIEKARIELEKAKEKYEDLRTRAKPYVEDAKTKYENLKIKSEPYIEQAKEKYYVIKEEAEKGKGVVVDTLENLSDDIEDETKRMKKKYFRGVKKR